MAAAVVTAAFENIGEADKIGIHVGIRVDQRIAHARLRGEMHDMRKPVLGKQCGHAVAVGEVELDETEARMPGKLREAGILQLRIVISVQVIKADNGTTAFQEPLSHVETDEPGSAGNEDRTRRHFTSTNSLDSIPSCSSRRIASATVAAANMIRSGSSGNR